MILQAFPKPQSFPRKRESTSETFATVASRGWDSRFRGNDRRFARGGNRGNEMKVPQCEREQAVTEMLQRGHWPEACDPALRAHVENCAVCSEVVLVTRLLREEHAFLSADMKLPDAGLVWWKAQLRARREAANLVMRPIALAEQIRPGLRPGKLVGLHGLEAGWFPHLATPFGDLRPFRCPPVGKPSAQLLEPATHPPLCDFRKLVRAFHGLPGLRYPGRAIEPSNPIADLGSPFVACNSFASRVPPKLLSDASGVVVRTLAQLPRP